MTTGYALGVVLLVSVLVTFSDTWDHTYGTELPEQAFFTIETEDGCLLTGAIFIIDVSHSITSSESVGGVDCWLLKTNSSGEELWGADFFSGPWVDLASAGLETPDGCFVLGGVTTIMESGHQFWLFKVDSEGNLLWEHDYGVSGNEWAFDVIGTDDGGFALTGYSTSFGNGSQDICLVRTNSTGDEEWSMVYRSTGDGMGEAVVQMDDGGFMIAGFEENPANGITQPMLLRTDPEGEELWTRLYPEQLHSYASDLILAGNGDFYLTGYVTTPYGDYDLLVARIDMNGEPIWVETFGGENDDRAYSVVSCPEGCVVAGDTYSYGSGGSDIWLVCIDDLGNEVWSVTHGGRGNESAEGIIRSADGGYIVSGLTTSKGAGNTDVWVLKLDEQGLLR